jgi:hypothetical protein
MKRPSNKASDSDMTGAFVAMGVVGGVVLLGGAVYMFMKLGQGGGQGGGRESSKVAPMASSSMRTPMDSASMKVAKNDGSMRGKHMDL